MQLRPLRVEDEVEATRAHELLAREGFEFLFDFTPGDDFGAYVARVDALAAGGTWSDRGVPGSFFLAEEEGRIVGRLSLRHELNDHLRRLGGHVGYCVLPAFRRRGLAKAMLREGLDRLRAVGVETALVTCDDDNMASRRVIESQGGRFIGLFEGERGIEGPRKRHYVFGDGELRVTR